MRDIPTRCFVVDAIGVCHKCPSVTAVLHFQSEGLTLACGWIFGANIADIGIQHLQDYKFQ